MSSFDNSEIKESEQEDMKTVRRRNKSGWLGLADNEDLRFLIDAILEMRPNKSFTPEDLQQRSGVSGLSLHRHIKTLTNYGIIELASDEDNPEYQVNNDSEITRELIKLNGRAGRMRTQNPELRRENRGMTEALKTATEIQKKPSPAAAAPEVPDIHVPTNLFSDLASDLDTEKSET